MKSKTTLSVLTILLAGAFVSTSIAQESGSTDPVIEPTQSESVPAVAEPEPKPESDESDAVQAMDDLLKSRETAPIIEPVGSSPLTSPGASVDIDPAVLGIAPGDDPPPLRREGEFIMNRRGRMVRATESGHRLFVFESDASTSPELPLVMQACQLLETMEETVDRRGDATTFILSGQIHTYRGANYLMPTMMNIAADTGNLTN